jgi:hypothetical protein
VKILNKAKYNLKHKEILDSFLLKNPFVKPGKMYGHPAYYIGGKLFASLYLEGVCVKVPETIKSDLLLKDYIEPFTPMGRKMKEWILINRKKSEDYLKDKDIFKLSIEYVASITGIKINQG